MVSVVIPTFNCGEYIGEAIESVLSQTYRKIEVIVVDDGSTDDTQSIVGKYGDKVLYSRHPNRGSSCARNIGIGIAEGDYLAFLDADDRWEPRKLEWQMECFRKIPGIGLVFTDFSLMERSGKIIGERYVQHGFPVFREYGLTIETLFSKRETIQIDNSETSNRRTDVYYGDIFIQLCKGNFILPSTTLFRRECVDSIGLRFREDYRCAIDQDYHLRFARHYMIAYLDRVTVNYRVGREGKLSGNTNIPQLVRNTILTIQEVLPIDEDPGTRGKWSTLYRTVVGKHLAILSYYYLSELDRVNARKYSLESLKQKKLLGKPILVLILSFAPVWFLDLLRKIKIKFL